MKKAIKKIMAVFLSIVLTSTVFALPFSINAYAAGSKNYVDGEAVVVLNEGEKNSKVLGGSIKLKSSYSFDSQDEDISVAVVKSPSMSTKQIIKKLKDNDAVKSVFPNYKKHASAITDDTYSSYQWALDNTGQNGGKVNADTNPESLWDKASQSENEKVVAIVDTGIDYNNPEFEGKLWENPYGKKLVGKYGYDFSDEIDDHSPYDNNGHGTHCAGIIAANADNAQGVSGINKSNVKIMAVKWLDSEGSGTTEGVLAAYDYIERAMELGTNVVAVNNSWGGVGDSDEQSLYDDIFDELGEKGAISVIAAGNESMDLENVSNDDPFSFVVSDEDMCLVPASSSSKYALTVAATNSNDELASYSNYSEKYVDIAAPGSTILSTVNTYCFNPSIYSDSKKAEIIADMQDYNGDFSGTSFGYPVVDTTTGKKDYAPLPLSDKLVVSKSSDYFGFSGNSVCIKTNESEDNKKEYSYVFSVPFTLDNENDDYSISLMFKGLGYSEVSMYDVPADYDFTDFDELETKGYLIGENGMNGWDHIYFTSSPEYDSQYLKSTNRKLLFLVEYVDDYTNTSIILDDFAISKQGVDTEKFEKYDFYSGTSMATPYVAGAVALLENAYPNARINDIINMIKNTGRYSAALEGKTENAKVLSLENAEKCPPLISEVAYNKDGNVSVTGSFMSVENISVDSSDVTAVSNDGETIILKDNNYNTKKVTVNVTNDFGQDSYTALLSKKTLYPVAKNVMGMPYCTSKSVMLQNEDIAYFVSESGTVGTLEYDEDEEMYIYMDADDEIDFTKLFKSVNKNNTKTVTSAVYSDGNIYFTAVMNIVSSTGTVIGYDTAFASYNIDKCETSYICELPADADSYSSLAAYKGNILLAGGITDDGLSNKVYKYNKTGKSLDEFSLLPEKRAGAKFISIDNMLVGMYGINEEGTLPSVLLYNGTNWSVADLGAVSDDFDGVSYNGNDYNLYYGNLGIENNGIFCNGSYIYGIGDTFVFNMKTKKAVPSNYSSKNTLNGTRLTGTTLPGCFIGFEQITAVDYSGRYSIFSNSGSTLSDLTALLTEAFSSMGSPHIITVSNEKYFPIEDEDDYDNYDWDFDFDDETETPAPRPTSKELKKAKLNKKLNLKASKISTTVNAKNKSIKSKGAKVSSASNYQIRYRKAGAKKWTYKYTNNKTNYSVKKLKAGSLYEVQIRALKKTSKGWQVSEWCKVSRRYVKTVKVTKTTPYKTAVRVNWKSDKKANGSEIIVYSDKACTKKVKSLKVKGSKTSRARIKGLKRKTKYYVKVRPIKKKNKKEYLGQLSSAKSFKTK